ncbi:MAG TPA: hypothetical protein PK971_11795 [Saprospiraceae bacterium]|nr:hypothetical protein [Saprospiraceae bacterium]HND89007.1 hypothetical protein [Saprospiraceae bacterium]HNG90281.1 hypothetical protein [Saprospiraceae bacterium]
MFTSPTAQACATSLQASRLFDFHPRLMPLRQGLHMSCDVIFGSPSQDCRGTGICKISAQQPPENSALRGGCQATTGICTALDGGQRLSIVFFREMLCVQLLRQHLMRDTLELKEPCPLPPALVRYLRLRIRALPPGRYRIEEGQGYYRVIF